MAFATAPARKSEEYDRVEMILFSRCKDRVILTFFTLPSIIVVQYRKLHLKERMVGISRSHVPGRSCLQV